MPSSSFAKAVEIALSSSPRKKGGVGAGYMSNGGSFANKVMDKKGPKPIYSSLTVAGY
jgi:hypothetical protein